MHTNQSLKRIIIPAMLVAVTVVISRFFIIPVPMTHGNVNLCDAGIFIAALMYGKRDGFIVGALSGFLLDLISGYSQYMFFSLVVHGLEGLVAGWIGKKNDRLSQVIAVTVGVVVMVVGYLISDTILYSLTPAVIGVPMNFLQGAVGAVIGIPVASRLGKALKIS